AEAAVPRVVLSGQDLFGDRPKFPPHGVLALLIAQQRQTSQPRRLQMIAHTLEAMSRGGIYDHVGGGFHRYATDERWLLPHFEKMLYDNAQLIAIYADAHELTGREDFRLAIAETFDWLSREMTDPGGGFYSALDADSLNEQGRAEEGKFYVWTTAEIIDTLGETDGKLFVDVYGITEEGNFRDEATGRRTGDSIPFLAVSPAAVAEQLKIDEGELRRRLAKIRQKLLIRREKRPRPHLDDKVLTAWNGLMIAGLARAGRLLDEPPYIEAATRAADFVLENLRDDEGRLLRTWRRGKAKLPAYLNDYAFFVEGLVELHEASGQDRWLQHALALADRMIEDFGNEESGGFFLTSAEHDTLLFRGTGLGGGGNIPSGGGVAAHSLVRLAALTKNQTYAATAAKAFAARKNSMWRQPYQAEHFILALDEYLDIADLDGVEKGKLPPLAPSESLAAELSAADASVAEPPLRVRAFASRDRVAPGSMLHVAVQIEIDKPWHIYSNLQGSEIPIKTRLTLESQQSTLEAVRYPPPEPIMDPSGGETLNTFSGKVSLLATIHIGPDAKGPVTLRLKLQAQACDERQCLQPRTYELPIKVRVSSDLAPAAQTQAPRHAKIFKALGVE
ncbi:MAG: protein-disulfide reductase DsbD family protein, partial [Planctomycetota bacterium]|nr:protein-disulfide reductase DsbD family protein [Planctomycetota bacterium]